MLAALHSIALAATVLLIATHAASAEDPKTPWNEADAWAALRPYEGPTGKIDDTLVGRVMVGYQGWFNAPGDGSGLGWRHWNQRGDFGPNHARVDLWPDVSDLAPDERVETGYRYADGSVAYVFSSQNQSVVRKHFAQMRDYGIDGAFVQRFAVEVRDPQFTRNRNVVLAAARRGANETNRSYAVMYDLSGLKRGETAVVIDDWKRLVDRAKLTHDPRDGAYLRHNGKPVVAVWGIGFDDRAYTLEECGRLIDFLKNDPTYGGNVVMVGIPGNWRTRRSDPAAFAEFERLLAKADILSPWAVGAFGNPDEARRYYSRSIGGDLAWANERKLEVMPVIFPGFSWHNMRPAEKLDQIPRRGGELFWTAAISAKRAGATMLYVAMFDEVDEGTAIFKLATTLPTNGERFANETNVPADQYLWLTGEVGKMLRGARPIEEAVPKR